MRGLISVTAAVVAVAAVGVGPASGQGVAGSWEVTWAQAVRINRDGSVEIQRWGDASLVLHQEGDRVFGTWTSNVLGRVTWKVEGTLTGARLTLSATEHDSDDPQLEQVQEMLWRGALAGDRLEGEMTLLFRGADRRRGWRPWRAVRAEPGWDVRERLTSAP